MKKPISMPPVGGIIVVLFLVVWGVWMALPHPDGTAGGQPVTQAADATGEATQSLVDQQRAAHDRRVPMSAYWDRTHADYSIAKSALAMALVALHDGRGVEASQMADKAKQYAYAGANDVANNVPEGWGEVESHLSNALAGMADLAGKFNDAVETDHPIAAKKAMLEADEYQMAEMADADRIGRELFAAAGGNPHDLSGDPQS